MKFNIFLGIVVAAGIGANSIAQAADPPTAVSSAGFARQQLSIGKLNKEQAAPDQPAPKFGYLSASAGAFTLNGAEGQASFIYNHDLDVDWHAHTLKFNGESADSEGNKYWVYSIEAHPEEYLAFSQQQAAGFPDEGYRVFYVHVEGNETHTHLIAWDAKRLPYHEHEDHE